VGPPVTRRSSHPIITPLVLARQPMSQQRADAVGTDVMHVMLCVRPEFIEEPQQKSFH